MHCYIAILECLGRMKNSDCFTKDVERFVQAALKKNITFDKMMSEGIFLNDERSFVLKALKTYYPSYVSTFDKTKLWYKNHLVNHLNNDHQLNFKVAESKGYGEFITPNVMNEMVQNQVNVEENGYITVSFLIFYILRNLRYLYFTIFLDQKYTKPWSTNPRN